jgi:hypothetical protein
LAGILSHAAAEGEEAAAYDLHTKATSETGPKRALGTGSFDGASFNGSPSHGSGSVDSLIDAVAATRAGIGAVRYDSVVNNDFKSYESYESSVVPLLFNISRDCSRGLKQAPSCFIR